MTEEEKILRKAQGYSIFRHKGKTICLNTKDFNREKFCKDWGFKEVEVFIDDEGNEMLYDPNYFEGFDWFGEKYLVSINNSYRPPQPIGCTQYYRMFAQRNFLTSLDISDWDFSDATKLTSMFDGCSRLEKVLLPKTTGNKLLTLVSMFSDCVSLKEIDLRDWDVSCVQFTNNMFRCCTSLEQVHLENWETRSLVRSNSMFGNCKALKRLDLSGWDTSNLLDTSNMFAGCSSLSELNVYGWCMKSFCEDVAMFDGCTELFRKTGTTRSVELCNKLFYSDGGNTL